jgi:hypothetical protein
MANDVIQFRAGAGYPGTTSRPTAAQTIVPVQLSGTSTPTAYGVAVTLDQNSKARVITAADTTDDVYGVLVRPFPTGNQTYAATIDTAVPPTTQVADVIKQGYVLVSVADSGTPVKGQPVYVCNADDGVHTVGAFYLSNLASGSPEVAYAVAVSGAQWVGGKDANGVAEIHLNRA